MRKAIDRRFLALPRVRQSGKELGSMPQSIVNYGLKIAEYIANVIVKLAKWQSTPAFALSHG